MDVVDLVDGMDCMDERRAAHRLETSEGPWVLQKAPRAPQSSFAKVKS